MDLERIIYTTVDNLFPHGTTRRFYINKIGKPVAKALGFPVYKEEQESAYTGIILRLQVLIQNSKDQGKHYWESILNFLRMKLALFLSGPENALEFPVSEKPLVSILLITFNKAEYTLQCLETIKANTDVPYEIIIVDNLSTDFTRPLLERAKNIEVILNNENTGFLRACNQGAQLAKGDFIMFLNNDTQVGPGWLKKLVSTFDENKDCGAVGAKLVFPDGKLQEAGSIVWRDGSCHGYGRDSNPMLPEFNYLKDVHYCSGACLLVRKDLFIQLGGFDDRYAPAYYEETDLCMGIRKLGYRVIYQPGVQIIHYEFGSGKKGWGIEQQIKNRQIFVEKWREVLAGYEEPKQENIIRARECCGRPKRILFIEDCIPDPALGSGLPRSFDILRSLIDQGYRITLIPLQRPKKMAGITEYLQQRGVEVFYGNRRLNFGKFFAGRRGYYDAAFVSRPHNIRQVYRYLKSDPHLKIIYDAEAIFALRDIRKAELKGKPFSENRINKVISKEVALAKNSDHVLTVSEAEKKVFEKYGADRVGIVGHLAMPNPTPSGFEERSGIVFLGYLAPDSPNEDSILYFAKEIFPLIQEKLGCTLSIFGDCDSDKVRALECDRIRILGRTENLFQAFDSFRVFVAPTRFAGGVPIKIYDAAAHGLPCVVSPLLAEQLGWRDRLGVLVGSDAKDFADKVVRLYTEKKLWEEIRQAGLDAVIRDCSRERFQSGLNGALKLI